MKNEQRIDLTKNVVITVNAFEEFSEAMKVTIVYLSSIGDLEVSDDEKNEAMKNLLANAFRKASIDIMQEAAKEDGVNIDEQQITFMDSVIKNKLVDIVSRMKFF